MGHHIRQKPGSSQGTRESLRLECLKNSGNPKDNCLGANLAGSESFLRVGSGGPPLTVMEAGIL